MFVLSKAGCQIVIKDTERLVAFDCPQQLATQVGSLDKLTIVPQHEHELAFFFAISFYDPKVLSEIQAIHPLKLSLEIHHLHNLRK